MGYTTEFDGLLKFKNELSMPQYKLLKTFMWANVDDHPEWKYPHGKPHYIQFEINDDMTGIQWDGSEKFYDSVEAANYILVNMQKEFPSFGLIGKLLAHGEDIDDRWYLEIVDGLAQRVDIVSVSEAVSCPKCGHEFTLRKDDE